MPRDIGSILPSTLELETQEFWDFIKIEFPSPVGTLRYTDRPGGFTGDIDGTSTEWVETHFLYGTITQTMQKPSLVNWVQFADLNSLFKGFIYSPGIRNVPITLYTGRWDVSTGQLIDSYPIFEGRMDDAEGDDEIKITIKAQFLETKVPYAKMSGRCLNDFMNPLDCQYPYTAGLTCAKTRAACRAYANEININIYDDLPLPGETMMYGGVNHGLKEAPGGD